MASSQADRYATVRVIFVIGLSVLLLVGSAIDLQRFSHPIGVFGYGTNLDGVVTGVDPGSPAFGAGIQVGDRLDESSMSPQELFDLIQIPAVKSAGLTRSFGVYHSGERREVSLVSVPEHMGVADEALILITLITTLVFIAIGATVVLLRPSPVSWGFFFFCIAFAPAGTLLFGLTEVYVSLPAPYAQYFEIMHVGVLHYAGVIGLLVFALRFLQEPISGWRLWAERALPFAFVSLVGVQTLYIVNTYLLGRPAETIGRIGIALASIAALVVMFALIDTYAHRQGAERQRIQWVVLGFAIALVANLAEQIAFIDATNAPFAVLSGLSLLNVMAPIAVAYAIVKHRVIDVSFVVSRALVYGVLTSLLVGAFALVDWLFMEKLKLARLGVLAEMGVAVAGGFWFNGLHKRVDSSIDAIFFRQRHRAELQLARNAAALPYATTTGAVSQALVTEPSRALALASAALFRRGRDGGFVREESEGWAAGDLSRMDDTDAHLLMLVQAEGGPLSLYDHPWRTEGVPSGPAHPALVMPVIVRRELAAIVFYGSHVHGEGLDPDEIKAIAGLAPGAAMAYDHLDAEAMQKSNEALRGRVESLESRLAVAQIQPA
jgi:hypothetical protein